MKSIIISIAIFLITLTAKADWVKSGELDSLYLGDAPITFSKYSPDYTKFVTYSAQDSTLRLWDLGTGKVIKERTFEKSYNVSICEYDFKNEKFMFLGDSAINNSTHGAAKHFLFYINFTNTIVKITIATSGLNETVNGTSKFFSKSIFIKDSVIQIFGELQTFSTTGSDQYTGISGKVITLQFLNDTIKKESFGFNSPSFIDKYQNGISIRTYNYYHQYGSHGGIIIDKTSEGYGNYIDFGKSKLDIYDLKNNEALYNKYPYFRTTIYSMDVAFNHLVFGDINGKINFYSKELDTLTHLSLPFKINQIRKLKLIYSQRYSIFFKDTSKLYVCDNQSKIILDTISITEGWLGFNPDSSLVYSFSGNNIYKTKINIIPLNYADVFTKRKRYLVGNKSYINAIIPDNISDYKITINNEPYYQTDLQLILPVGFYNVKLMYKEKGIQNVVSIDSIFQIVDSLKYTYSVTNNFDNNAKYPFIFKASTNDSLSTINWEYSWPAYGKTTYGGYSLITKAIGNNSSTASFYYNTIGNYTSFRIHIYNDLQSFMLPLKLDIKPNLVANFSAYSGTAPFKFKVFFDNTYLSYASVYKGVDGFVNSVKEYQIGDIIKKRLNGLKIDTTEEIIVKPGIYKIKLVFPKDDGDYFIFHDSVITVLAPTDIKDFDERNYIFKQDADGIFCQLKGEGEVTLYDNVGRLVRTYQIQNERYIRKEDLERGFYFLQINLNGEVYHEKVLVE